MMIDRQDREAMALELSAVVVAVTGDEPRVLTVDDGTALPSGPLEPGHRTLERGLRSWVAERSGLTLGYVEQLYTFADRGRVAGDPDARMISLSYLALTREPQEALPSHVSFRDWYQYFPWEDLRGGGSAAVIETILPRLQAWIAGAPPEARGQRAQRVLGTFGSADGGWDEELVLQRYELLFEAGLVPEAARVRAVDDAALVPGLAMRHDHRRILATGMARLRAKIKYRPVVFELMPESFTLLKLQRAVEGLAGRRLHKQNFRRVIAHQALVEETGAVEADTGGRPARQVRFRREILLQRAVSGTKLSIARPER